MGQFATIMCFVWYMGMDQFDMRMAPMYQEKLKADAEEQARREIDAVAVATASGSSTKKEE